MKQKLKIRELLITLAVILIIIIGITFLFFYRQVIVTNQDNQSTNTSSSVVLAVDDKKSYKVDDKTIKLPEGWEIQLSIRSTNGTNLICESANPDLCTINYVANSSTRFLLTTPSPVVPKDSRDFTTEEKKLNFLGNDTTFTYKRYSIEKRTDLNENGESEQSSDKVYSLISGCNGNICLNTELLSEDFETNKKQVEAFEGLVKAIKVE